MTTVPFSGIARPPLSRSLALRLKGALVACVIAPALFVVPAVALDPTAPAPATLTVSASAEVTARPDLARVDVGVTVQGRTTAEALARADEAAAAIVAEAKASGIAAADVATARFAVQPQWTSPKPNSTEPPRISGFSVSNDYTLKVRRLADLGGLLERLVSRGANTVSGVSFDVSDAEARRDEARAAAIKAARHRAELLADAADQRILRVLSINEGALEDAGPRPVMAMAMKSVAAAPVPIEAGSRTIQASVTMVFEIGPREQK